MQTFDAAFQSRIHISLQYEELDGKSRKTVWKNFLKQHDIAQAAARERPAKALVSAAKATPNGSVPSLSQQMDGMELQESDDLHLKRTLPHQITDGQLKKLCDLKMNGRQIKNILKTAQLLASKKREGLSYEHVTTVMEVTQHLHNSTMENERTKSSLFN